MILELTKSEIKRVEDYIQETFKYDPEFKYYFTGGEKRNYSDRGFLIGDRDYYIDVEEIAGVNFIGMIKLKTPKDNNTLTDLISLFKKLYDEYGVIGIWRDIDNKKVEKLHNHIKKDLKKKVIE